MNRKIWIVAFACASFIAAAQSSSTSKNTNSRENGSGQASGKVVPKSGASHDREASVPSVSEGVAPDHGNMAGNHKDGWNAVTSSDTKGNPGSVHTSDGSTSQWPSRVATGDVNGDGRADVTAKAPAGDVNGDGHADVAASTTTNSASNKGQNSKEISSGMPTGRRQHEPVTVHKEVDKTTPKL